MALLDANDDFIEVLNVTDLAIDMSEYRISEAISGRTVHIFPEGTLLEAGCSIVVGSEGFLPGSELGRFGTAPVQNASEGNTLSITDTGAILQLDDSTFTEAFSLTIPDLTQTAAQGSYALTTDGDFNSGYAQHADIAATAGALSSPGTLLGGDPFCDVTAPVTVTDFSISDS